MKIIIILILYSVIVLSAQGFQGPAEGNVSSGINKSTDDFENNIHENLIQESLNRIKPEVSVNQGISPLNMIDPVSDRSIKTNDPPFIQQRETGNNLNLEMDFDGPSIFNCWVPDCNVIPGPVDLLLAINTMFTITDKQGNVIKQINTNTWFSEFIGNGLVFDPKCYYDSYSHRFIMTYLYYDSPTATSLMLLCVSDDSTAQGNWNIWSLPANVNGSQPDPAFADFPTMTVTDEAIYWLNDMYPYGSGNPKYVKLRVIKKSDVLSSNPGEVNWKDLWDFRNPLNSSATVRTLKLVHDLDNSGSVYMIGLPNPSGATFNFIFLYQVNDNYNDLNVTSNSVSCSGYSMPPYMAQPGGGKPMQLWWFFYSEQVQRNGKIYAAHSVRSQNGITSDIHYMEIDTASNTLSSEIFIDHPDYFYGYTDIMADSIGNVYMVYNRSSSNEYPGIFYSSKRNGMNNFSEDIPLKTGEGDMNVFCGNTTNPYIRFEDYTDIMFDPADPSKLWIMGEYTGSDNKWKTRIGKISIDNTIGITNVNPSVPDNFLLEQNFPNPFNPSTIVRFSIKHSGKVKLKVSNSLGKDVVVLINDNLQPGSYEYNFDGSSLSSGVYYYTLQGEDFYKTRSMLLIK